MVCSSSCVLFHRFISLFSIGLATFGEGLQKFISKLNEDLLFYIVILMSFLFFFKSKPLYCSSILTGSSRVLNYSGEGYPAGCFLYYFFKDCLVFFKYFFRVYRYIFFYVCFLIVIVGHH